MEESVVATKSQQAKIGIFAITGIYERHETPDRRCVEDTLAFLIGLHFDCMKL